MLPNRIIGTPPSKTELVVIHDGTAEMLQASVPT